MQMSLGKNYHNGCPWKEKGFFLWHHSYCLACCQSEKERAVDWSKSGKRTCYWGSISWLSHCILYILTVVRRGREKDAVTFAELHRKLRSQGLVKNRWAILYLMMMLSENESKIAKDKVIVYLQDEKSCKVLLDFLIIFVEVPHIIPLAISNVRKM